MSDRPNQSSGTESGSEDVINLPVVCPHCLTRNALRQHFCRRCGTPLTDLAVTDPLGQVFSEGDGYRKAIDNPERPITFIGMWLIFGPMFFVCVSLIVWFIVGAFTSPLGPIDVVTIFAMVLVPVMFGGLGIISGIVLFRTTRNFFRARAASNEE